MSIELPRKLEGEPGICIDEGYSESKKYSYISCSVFNEEGDIVFYTDFPRDVTPREIYDAVTIAASGLLVDPMEMKWKEAEALSDRLFKEAEKVL